MAIDTITHAELLAQVHYDPETGLFTRYKPTPGIQHKGGGIGTFDSNGYRLIMVNRKRYRSSRLAWFYVHGEWPKQVIDHINGDKTDDRIANLRDVFQSTNMQNQQRPQRNGTSGYLGAHWNKRQQEWTASINVNGKLKHLGRYATPQEAHAAYLGAKRILHKGCTI